MGGGVWSRVSRVIHSSPGIGLGSIAPTAAGSSSVRIANASMMQASAVAVPSLRFGGSDDWELAGGEEEDRGSIRDKLMFGSQPSSDEVREATTDLTNALAMCVGDECVCAPQGFTPPVSSPRSEARSVGSSSLFCHPVDWIEPRLVSHTPGTVEVRRRSEVADAFRLLQTDSVVQGVVMSIASDKTVWEAVLNNDKVKEFRKKLQDGVVEESTVDRETVESTLDGGMKNVLDSLMSFSKGACLRLQSILNDMVSGLLSVFDKLFGEKGSDLADRALKSCFMLSVMVLSVVLLKRATS